MDIAQKAAELEAKIAGKAALDATMNAKEQATSLEYNLQTPNNGGEIRNNSKISHLKAFSPEGVIGIRPDQDKIDFYENLKLNPPHEDPYEAYMRELSVNLAGVFLSARVAAKQIKKQEC